MLSLPKHLARIAERLELLLHARCFAKLSMTASPTWMPYLLHFNYLQPSNLPHPAGGLFLQRHDELIGAVVGG